jgi:hypothetical protein
MEGRRLAALSTSYLGLVPLTATIGYDVWSGTVLQSVYY